MTCCLRNADDRCSACSDGNRQGETTEAGEAFTDSLGEDDVHGPADCSQAGVPDADHVDVAAPGLGDEHDPEPCSADPDERSAAVAVHCGDGHRTEELN